MFISSIVTYYEQNSEISLKLEVISIIVYVVCLRVRKSSTIYYTSTTGTYYALNLVTNST